MKKVFTFFVALAFLVSASQAQTSNMLTKKVRNDAKKEVGTKGQMVKYPVKSNAKTKAVGDTVATFPWTEGFEGTTPTGFTFVDNDNDGNNWIMSNSTGANFHVYSGTGAIISASYDNNTATALTPDNWMILPTFTLPSDATDFTLTWWERGQDATYCAEFYSVYISTTGRNVANFTSTTAVLTSTATGNWVMKSVNLGSYAGQTINIAFRHHNVTDMFYLNIDEITVGTSTIEPEMTLTGPATGAMGTPINFTATNNFGVSTATWYVDGTLVPGNSNLTLSYTFNNIGTHEVVAEIATQSGTVLSDTVNIDIVDPSTYVINTFPWIEDFEATDIPVGFSFIDNDNDGNNWYLSNFEGNNSSSGTGTISSASYINGVGALTPDNWMILPPIAVPTNASDFTLSWYEGGQDANYSNEFYSVYISTSGRTVSDFATPAFSSTSTDVMTLKTVNLSSYAGQTINIAFRHYNITDMYILNIDDITVGSSTIIPEMSLTGPVQTTAGTPVTFTAINNMGINNATWYVDGSAVPGESNLTLTYTFTTAGNHEVVANINTASTMLYDTIYINVIDCSTSLINTFPYTYDFETENPCWQFISMDPANDDRIGINTNAHSGDYSFAFSSWTSASDYNQYLISPEIQLPATGQYMVKFWYLGYTANDAFRVLASTTNNDLASFTTVLGDNPTVNAEWTEVAYTLPANTKYIAINYYGNYAFYLYVDDLSIETLTVPTVTIEGPEIAPSDAEITFTAHSSTATSFEWAVDNNTVPGVSTNTMTYTFTTGGTHTVSVTAFNEIGSSTPATMTVNVTVCNINSFPWTEDFEDPYSYTCWTFIDNDGDGYNWDPTYLYGNENPAGHNGSDGLVASASYNNSTATPLTPDNWMILPAVDVPEGSNLSLSWYVKGQDPNYCAENYSVYISTNGRSISDFSNPVFNEVATGDWTLRSVNIASYAGQTIYIAFRHHDVTDMFYLDIDDITIAEGTNGINDANDANVSIFPNPTSNIVNITADNYQYTEIYDATGRKVITTNNGSIDMSNLANGVYLFHVVTINGTSNMKVVKR